MIERVELLQIKPAGALDPINVYWHNIEPGRGHVTITCFGSAWTCYFGRMGGESIQTFFATADTGYLVTKLGYTPHLKSSKRDLAYLARIIEAVKAALAEANRPPAPGHGIDDGPPGSIIKEHV